ncbi:MAG: hypothetical protein KF819_33145 [Labilithrix sp.]|nr:hypothetical protein [Labilithrix sp.]
MRAWTVIVMLCACQKAPAAAGGSASADANVAPIADAAATAEIAETTQNADAATPPKTFAKVETDWCIDGLEALDEDACYVLPKLAEGKPRRLLVYLHGIVPPLPTSTQKHTVHTIVMQASTRAGAAAIVPRGRRGIGPSGAKDWYAWPTAPATHAQHAAAIIARWIELKKKVEERAGAPFERTYLAGSSNGAYFIAALSMRSDLDEGGFAVDGFGAMSGGSAAGKSAAALTGKTPRPYYVGFGTYDDETKVNAKSLVAVLTAAAWPLRVAEHAVGHGAKEIYLDEAFAFWDAQDVARPR